MIASKFLDDFYCRNVYFAMVGGMSNEVLNDLELRLCFMLDFDLNVSKDDFEYAAFHLSSEACFRPSPSTWIMSNKVAVGSMHRGRYSTDGVYLNLICVFIGPDICVHFFYFLRPWMNNCCGYHINYDDNIILFRLRALCVTHIYTISVCLCLVLNLCSAILWAKFLLNTFCIYHLLNSFLFSFF